MCSPYDIYNDFVVAVGGVDFIRPALFIHKSALVLIRRGVASPVIV